MEVKQQIDLKKLTVKELRKLSIARGYGITYLSERKKAELIKIIEEQQSK